jgi:hypothetical protein
MFRESRLVSEDSCFLHNRKFGYFRTCVGRGNAGRWDDWRVPLFGVWGGTANPYRSYSAAEH